MAAYDPSRRYEVKTQDVEYLRHADQPYLARVYQPDGDGPFPMLVYVHGGAWNLADRTADALINERMAATGLVIVALDFRLAPAHPYPAQIADVNFGTRWMKAHAADFKGDASRVGGIGSSSGGHTLLLSAMRPTDVRYAEIPLPAAPRMDARIDYVVALWSVLDPYARYEFARTTPAAGLGYGGAEEKLRQTMGYFLSEAALHEGNPQEILERGEPVELPSILIIQGTEDMNIPLNLPQRFAPTYRAAGGTIAVAWFPGMPHGFGGTAGPETDRAIEQMKAFVAREVAVVPTAV